MLFVDVCIEKDLCMHTALIRRFIECQCLEARSQISLSVIWFNINKIGGDQENRTIHFLSCMMGSAPTVAEKSGLVSLGRDSRHCTL